MRRMLDPNTIALIGATETEGTVGRTIIENLMRSRERKIFPVNPHHETIFDLKCYPSIEAVPEPIDLAIVATPAAGVPDVLEQCAKVGVHGAIVVSAGFGETGKQGKELEKRIKKILADSPMRVVGPNCLGIIRPSVGLNASFLSVEPEAGDIALISQSGALGTGMLDWAVTSHVGFSFFASVGSMVDVDFADLVDFLGEDPHTRSILIYMESIGNARRFMSAARSFARNKPIIVLKPGRYSESARAALSHTGAMAGGDEVYEAAFKRVGVVRVHEVADLFRAAEVLDSRRLPTGADVAIVTNAGGLGVMATDSIVEHEPCEPGRRSGRRRQRPIRRSCDRVPRGPRRQRRAPHLHTTGQCPARRDGQRGRSAGEERTQAGRHRAHGWCHSRRRPRDLPRSRHPLLRHTGRSGPHLSGHVPLRR
jgi:acetyltransferase